MPAGGLPSAPPGWLCGRMTPASHAPSRARLAVALGALASLLTACSGTETPSPTLDAGVTEVATDLEVPWEMVAVGESVLVSERDSGRIIEIAPDRGTREVLVVPDVRFGGEGGLLGLAVDPSAEHLYAYSTGDEGNRVQRYEIGGQPGALTLTGAEDVVAGLPSAGNHNGGRIAFGPDGMLYVTVGDAGDRPAAQDIDALAGKILRLEPDGTVPGDNPFPGSPVYSYGHRNPQGIAWSADGRMFASEFGQDTWDELNIIEPGGNYGWPVVEGVGGAAEFIDPVQVWAPDDASPSGLTVVGETLYLANLRGERLRAIPVDDPSTSTEYLVGEFGRLRAVMPGPDDRLWISTSNRGGRGQSRSGDDRIVSIDPARYPG